MTTINPIMNEKHITADGLIMKGVSRIEAINTRSEERIQSNFRTWQMCRLVRRDFNLLTAKMFIRCLDSSNVKKIRAMLLNIQSEAEVLNNLALRYEMPKELAVTVLPLRVVSDEAKLLYESIITVDWALAKLLNSEMSEVAFDNCSHFNETYCRLKKYIINRPKFIDGQKKYN